MKKIFCRSALFFVVAGVTGCTVPQKSVQSPPPAPIITVQRPPVGVVRRVERDGKTEEPEVLAPPEVEAATEKRKISYPSLRYVNERILTYGRKLDRWKELDKEAAGAELPRKEIEKSVRCFREVQKMLDSYNAVRNKMIHVKSLDERADAISTAEIFTLQRDDTAFLEGECAELLKDDVPGSLGWGSDDSNVDLEKLERLISRHFAAEGYEEVVQAWRHIPAGQRSRVSIRTKVNYGNALMYLHQEEKAADVYREVVQEMAESDEQALDLISLRRVLADLYTAGGNYRAAGEQYEKISKDYQNLGRLEEWSKLQLSILDRAANSSPELVEYSSLLRNFLGFIPRKDGYNVVWEAEQFLTDYPYSPVTSNIDFIKQVSGEMADKWFVDQVGEVDRLIGLQKFEEAEAYLDSIPVDIISSEKQFQLKEKKEELQLASAVSKETEKLEKLQILQHRWNEAMLLARDGHYDEALAAFHELEETEYRQKAMAQVDKLILEAANTKRREAAQLYRRYTKTTDVQTQKQLLLDARNVLKDILEKYPNKEIFSKVEDNLLRVEEELKILDPQLLHGQDSAGENRVNDGVDATFQLQPKPQQPQQLEVEDLIMEEEEP